MDAGGGRRGRAFSRAARALRARPLRRPRRGRARSCALACSPQRDARPQPFRDDKALASWNGLALAALAEAGLPARARRLARRPRAVSASSCSARSPLPTAGSSARARDGRTSGHGFLDDYANVANGLIELHVATGELRWLTRGSSPRAARGRALRRRRARRLLPLAGGRRRARAAHEGPPGHARSRRATRCSRTSSCGSVALWGDDELERRAVSVFRLAEPALRRAPGFFAWMLCGIDLWLSPPRELAIVGDVESPVARAALAPFRPAHGRRRRPVRRGPAARRQGTRRRQDRRLRLRALRLPRSRRPSPRRCSAHEAVPDDRGTGGRDLGRLGASRATDGGARARGALPLRPLHGDHPAGRRRARRVGDARRARGAHASASGSARWCRPRPSAIRACSPGWPSRSTTSRAAASRWGWAPAGTSASTGRTASRSPTRKERFELFAEQVEIVVRSWTEERFDHDGPAYRLRRPAGAAATGAAAAPAARPRWDGQAALRRARGALRDRGEHARRAERRAPCAQGRARPRLRGRRPRSRDARLLGDDLVLPRGVRLRRSSSGSRASSPLGETTAIRRP